MSDRNHDMIAIADIAYFAIYRIFCDISHILRYIAYFAIYRNRTSTKKSAIAIASSSRNAQLSQLVSHCPSDFQSSPVDQILDVREFPFLDEDFVPRVGKVERI